MDKSIHWKSMVRPVLAMKRPRVTFEQSQTLILEALELSNDQNLGLAVGRLQTFASTGILGAALLACENHLQSLQMGVRYHRLTGSMLDLDLQILEDGSGALTARARTPVTPIMRFLIQELFANVTQISQFLYRTGNPTECVDLIFDASETSIFRTAFGCPVNLNMTENRLIIRQKVLEARNETADRFALSSIIPVLDSLMAQERQKQNLLSHVESILHQQLPGSPSMGRVANQIGMSERSLRRKLNEAATTFRDVLSNVRKSRTMELVLESDLSLETIAQEVGFEDARSLRRNLMRWTGTSARKLREKSRKQVP